MSGVEFTSPEFFCLAGVILLGLIESRWQTPARGAAQARPSQVRCPYCRQEWAERAAGVSCAACRTLHHDECWEEHGGCSVFGCVPPRRPQLGNALPTPAAVTPPALAPREPGTPALT